MAFNPTNNPSLPPNTALVSTGVIFSLESTGFAQRGIARDASGNILFEGPETTADIFVIFDVLYTELYPFSSNQPPVEVNIVEIPPPPPPKPKPQEIVEQRKQKEQLKKDRVEQSELTSTDIEGINNAVAEDQKPKGLQKLGSLVLKQSQKLSKFVIPLAFNLIKEYGIDKLETALEEESDNIDELKEQLKEEFCNVQLPQIIAKRNNAVDYLNNTGKILDSFTLSVDFGASFPFGLHLRPLAPHRQQFSLQVETSTPSRRRHQQLSELARRGPPLREVTGVGVVATNQPINQPTPTSRHT